MALHKVLTIRPPHEIRQARLLMVVTQGQLERDLEDLVLRAVDAWRGPNGEHVVLTRDAKNRHPDGEVPPGVTERREVHNDPGPVDEAGEYGGGEGDRNDDDADGVL